MKSLPIDEVLDQLSQRLSAAGAVVLRAPTGAGKTTRVPPRLLGDLAPGQRLIVVEPRRVAARAAAARVAFEQRWTLGREVGYRIRFDDRSSSATRLLFVTEGVLLAWIQRDPFLEGIGALVFDEFHERSLASDLALSMAEQVRRTVRDDLRLVVMSATLESRAVARFLGDCPVVESRGRLHPIEVEYLSRPDDRHLVAQAVFAVARVLATPEEKLPDDSAPDDSAQADSAPSNSAPEAGDILVFLPGVSEIVRAQKQLEPMLASAGIRICPLYGDLPLESQQAALSKPASGERRVILATNVAETSVTVEGVTTVIDTGVERRLEVDPATGFDRLELRPISKRSATQRKGRAGRERAGRCLRLWTESQHTQRLETTPPEVQRVDLAVPLLSLVAWGEADPLAFPWFEPPDSSRAQRALELLEALGALELSAQGSEVGEVGVGEVESRSRCAITADGRVMATFGCHPRFARLLLDAARDGALERGARLAALLDERDIFRCQDRGAGGGGWHAPECRSDALERLHALEAWEQGRGGRGQQRLVVQRARQVSEVAKQLSRSVQQAGVRGARKSKGGNREEADDLLLRALLRAFPDRLARRRPRDAGASVNAPASDRAVLVGGRGVRLASSSGVRNADLFLALDVGRATAAVSARGSGPSPREAVVFLASEVREEWLDPDQVREQRTVTWDDATERVRAEVTRSFGDLVLESREVPATAPEIETALAHAAAACPEKFLALDDRELEQLLARVASLRQWRPELGLPDLSLAKLTEILPGLLPQVCAGCRSSAELSKVRLLPHIEGFLDWSHRQALEQHAPAELQLTNGVRARLGYDPSGGLPVLALRIQQLFGVRETPTVNQGRQPVLLHLLAPNQRPQQITGDLAGFWSGTYALVKKDLAGRYPKHSWPDDPASAEPPRRRR